MKNRTHIDETRSASSRPSSAVIRSLRKQSDGLARVWETIWPSRSCSHPSAAFSSAFSAGLNLDRVTTPNCSRISGRSASAIPISSHRTAMGSGNAKADIRSTVSLLRHSRRSSSAISVIRGRMSSTRRGVKALRRTRRSRVWRGGSENSTLSSSASKKLPNTAW